MLTQFLEIIIVGRSLLLLLQIPLFRGENLGTGWQLGLQQTGQSLAAKTQPQIKIARLKVSVVKFSCLRTGLIC